MLFINRYLLNNHSWSGQRDKVGSSKFNTKTPHVAIFIKIDKMLTRKLVNS